jgi:hypothetical protein
MLRPVTCPKCKSALGWYRTSTGCLEQPVPPAGVKVFGAYLVCPSCETSYKFDGKKIRSRMKRDSAAAVSPKPIATKDDRSNSPSFTPALLSFAPG